VKEVRVAAVAVTVIGQPLLHLVLPVVLPVPLLSGVITARTLQSV
jgi:hypothetical protein